MTPPRTRRLSASLFALLGLVASVSPGHEPTPSSKPEDPWAEVAAWEGRIASSTGGICDYRSLVYALDRAFEADERRAQERWDGSAGDEAWRLERDETLRHVFEAWRRAAPGDTEPEIALLERFATPAERRAGLAALRERFPDDLGILSEWLDHLVAAGETEAALADGLAFLAGDPGRAERRTYQWIRDRFPATSPAALALARAWRERSPDDFEALLHQIEGEIPGGSARLAQDLEELFARIPEVPLAELVRGGASYLPYLCEQLGTKQNDRARSLACLERLHGAIAALPRPAGEPEPTKESQSFEERSFFDLDRRLRRALAERLAEVGRADEIAVLERATDPDFRADVANGLRNRDECPEAIAVLAPLAGRELSPEAARLAVSAAGRCHEVAGAPALLAALLPGAPDEAHSYLDTSGLPKPLFDFVWADLSRRESSELAPLRATMAVAAERQGLLSQEVVAAVIEGWIERLPDDPRPRWELYHRAIGRNDLERAPELFEAAARREPPGSDRPFQEAQGLFWSARRAANPKIDNDLVEAAAQRVLAAAHTPKQRVQAHQLLGQAASDRGQVELALEHYRQSFPVMARFQDPRSADSDYLKLLVLSARFDELERYLDLAFTHQAARWRPTPPPDPRSQLTYLPNPPPDRDLFFGEAYLRIDQPERALPHLFAAFGRSPDDRALRSRLGSALFQAGRAEESRKLLEGAFPFDDASLDG